MRNPFEPPPARRGAATEGLDQLEAALSAHIVGQPEAVNAVAPYVRLYQASLSPDGRPVGVFLLLGPSGTGKTRTVEALAQVLHGDEKKVVKIDCGEFQMEHEVAKLIGAPPGYLGHKETTPMLNQARLNQTTSDRSSLSIVLFDEIEKAAPSLQRLLLGVLDRVWPARVGLPEERPPRGQVAEPFVRVLLFHPGPSRYCNGVRISG